MKPVKLHRAAFESLHRRRFKFCRLTVSLWLASAPSLFSHLWLHSLLKALTHALVCTWSRWTPTPSHHHGSRLLTGCESMRRSPLSEYQSAASLSITSWFSEGGRLAGSPTAPMWWELMGDSQTGMPWAKLDTIYHHSMLPLILFRLLRFCLLLEMLEKCCFL